MDVLEARATDGMTNLIVRIRVKWHPDTTDREPVVFGVIAASGYNYAQQLSGQPQDELLVTVPSDLAGTAMEVWTNVGSYSIQSSTIELTNTWKGSVPTADGRTVNVGVEWYDGNERMMDDIETPPVEIEVSDTYKAWELIRNLHALEDRHFVYRGECEPYQGSMQSPMARRWGLNEEDLDTHTCELLRAAREYAGVSGTDEQVLAECQHMGIEMNVLDFTKSTLVALWFASQPTINHADGRVLVVDPNKCRRPMIDTHLPSKRMAAQRGVLLHAGSVDFPSDSTVRSILVKASWKKHIRDILRQHGISHVTLFPGVESFAEDIRLGRIKFTHTQEKAAIAALDRGDYRSAIAWFEDVAEWHARQDPKNDGGYFNARRFSNLACALAMNGQFDAARKTANRSLQNARRSGNHKQMRVAQELLDRLSRAWVRVAAGLLQKVSKKSIASVSNS